MRKGGIVHGRKLNRASDFLQAIVAPIFSSDLSLGCLNPKELARAARYPSSKVVTPKHRSTRISGAPFLYMRAVSNTGVIAWRAARARAAGLGRVEKDRRAGRASDQAGEETLGGLFVVGEQRPTLNPSRHALKAP